MGVTQKMIAEKAGVSVSLVSRILNGKVRHITVSEATDVRVRRIADESGYRVKGGMTHNRVS